MNKYFYSGVVFKTKSVDKTFKGASLTITVKGSFDTQLSAGIQKFQELTLYHRQQIKERGHKKLILHH